MMHMNAGLVKHVVSSEQMPQIVQDFINWICQMMLILRVDDVYHTYAKPGCFQESKARLNQ